MKNPTPLLLSLAFIAVVATGCSQAGPARYPIAGNIQVGGRPLAAGRIQFVPIAPTEGPVVSTVVVDGKYELNRKNGPVIGKHRVEVEADLGVALDDEEAMAKLRGRLPPQPIPPQFNRFSTLEVEVTADKENTFDVAVPGLRQTVGRPVY